MILQFSVSNYKCFRKLQTLNMAASRQDKSLPENCVVTDLPGLTGKQWVKGVALYGANASGKTTVIKALEALADMVRNSAKITDPKEPIAQIEPFALAPGEPESPTAFAVAFVVEGIRYEYRVAATRQRVWHESLRAFPKAKEQLWFNRDWNENTEMYLWSPERPTGFQREPLLESFTLKNTLFLSKAVANNRAELEPVFRWFESQLQFLNLGEWRQDQHRLTLGMINEKPTLEKRVSGLLLNADLGVTGIRILEDLAAKERLQKMLGALVGTDGDYFKPELAHKGFGNADLPLPWNSESAGTRQLFGLIGPWLDTLSNGYTVCMDELETRMHPLMVRELLRLFFSASENQKGAQIIFTTHNPLLLDTTLFRRDQIWFTDKDENGEAHLYPLTDYQPRKGESLVRGYLSGRYGAVPFVPAGLLGSFQSEKAAHE